MSGEDRRDAPGPVQPAPAGDGWRGGLRNVENLLVSLALAALVLLPLGEIVLRKVFQTGISGATAFEQHLTLLIGLLGGALAAREGRLLTLSTLTDLLKGRGQVFARVFSSAFAAGISVFLCVAAAQLVQTEKEAGKILAYGIPLWTIQLVMPVEFRRDCAPFALACGGTLARTAGRPAAGRRRGVDRTPAADRARHAGPACPVDAAAGRRSRRADLCAAGRRRADSVLGARPAHRVHFAHPLFDGDQPHAADGPAVHAGRVFPGGGRRVETADPGLSGRVRTIPRRTGDCHGAGVRIFHLIHRRVRRDDSRVGRPADAGADGRGVFGAFHVGIAHRLWRSRAAVPAFTPVDSLRHCGQPQRQGWRSDHRKNVSRRPWPGAAVGGHGCRGGHSAGSERHSRAARV